MLAAVVACGITLRLGLQLRRARRFRQRRPADLRKRHLRFAKPAVAAIAFGFLIGPISAVWLRDWEPLRTFHALVGIIAALLFGAAAVLGRRIEKHRSRDFDTHAILGLLAMLAALVGTVAGFVLLP
jgi:hypothetical protein